MNKYQKKFQREFKKALNEGLFLPGVPYKVMKKIFKLFHFNNPYATMPCENCDNISCRKMKDGSVLPRYVCKDQR